MSSWQEIRSRDISPLFEQQKDSLIYTMKTACLEGFARQAAGYQQARQLGQVAAYRVRQ